MSRVLGGRQPSAACERPDAVTASAADARDHTVSSPGHPEHRHVE